MVMVILVQQILGLWHFQETMWSYDRPDEHSDERDGPKDHFVLVSGWRVQSEDKSQVMRGEVGGESRNRECQQARLTPLLSLFRCICGPLTFYIAPLC